jgi:tetratricopeptide (TPR) repeat protein
MQQVYFDGKTREMEEKDFLMLIESLVGGAYVIAKTLHYQQVGGFPDVLGGWESWCQRQLEQQQTLIPQIKDDGLRELCHILDLHTRRIVELGDQFIEAIARFFDSKAPQTRRDRQRLVQKMDKCVSSQGPVWADRPEYKQIVHQSELAFGQAERTKHQIDGMLAKLLVETSDSPEDTFLPTQIPHARLTRPRNWEATDSYAPTESGEHEIESDAEEFGDQRAKDLIDEADAELEHNRAIKLLHKALRFGRTGIQAHKAYLGLAVRYEDLGNDVRAIKYYTKAMEAWRPTAVILFWRGRLYYRREQWEQARIDFARALGFPSSEGLASPERELAENYLAEVEVHTKEN